MNRSVFMIIILFIDMVVIGHAISSYYETRRKIPDTQLGYCLIASFAFVILRKYIWFDTTLFIGLLYLILFLFFYRISWKEALYYTLILSVSRNLVYLCITCIPVSIYFQILIIEGIYLLLILWEISYLTTLHISKIIIIILTTIYALSSYMIFDYPSIVLTVLLSCLYASILYLIKYLNQLHLDSLKLQTIEQTISIQQQYMDKQKQEMNNFHKQKHDLLARLEILYLLEKNQEYEALHQQLMDMSNQISSIRLEEYTTIIAIDSVLSYYHYNYPQIDITYDCDHFLKLSISDYDISTLCINILKNAVEASFPIDHPKIHLMMKQRYQKLYISCENDYQPGYKKQGHDGWGLSIIEDITQRNHGKYQIHKISNRFQIEFFFPIGE